MAANPYTTNLELQLDARDITGLTDGDSVTTWTDSSAAGNDVTQATGSRRPVYKTSIIGSSPVVRFASDNTKSLYATLASSWSGYGGITAIALAQYVETPTGDNRGFLAMHSGSGDDFNGAGNFVVPMGTSNAFNPVGRNTVFFVNNNTSYNDPMGCMIKGKPSVFGFAIQTSTTGMKYISEYGAASTGSSNQMTGTPTDIVIGNRYVSGAISTSSGGRFDLAALLIYKEYMSDSNIADVVDWLLTEFDLHTQAAGGSSSILRMPGMTGGMNG